MTYELDPELAPAMTALAAQAAAAAHPARGDWQAVRAAASAGLAHMASLTPASSGVTRTSYSTLTTDGEANIELRWYTKAGMPPGSAVVYTHGGGMIAGNVDLYDEVGLLVCGRDRGPVPVRRATPGPRADEPDLIG